MFAYNPGVYDQSGQIIADGTTRAAAINAQMLNDLGKNVGDGMKKAASAVAGFAMGGPAGAAMAAQGGSRGGSDSADSVIGSFVNAYANDKALRAKGEAYGDFMKRHGQQLGFDPGYLEDFLKRDPREQAMIGDSIIGMQNTGNRLMSLNYMNQQANLFGGGRGTGAGGGTASGGGGSQRGYQVGQGWVGYGS